MLVKQYNIKLDGEIESRRSKTSKDRMSQRMEGRKNSKQNKNKRSSKVFSVLKEIYSRT